MLCGIITIVHISNMTDSCIKLYDEVATYTVSSSVVELYSQVESLKRFQLILTIDGACIKRSRT